MPSLPEDIIEENILTRLPVESILRFRSVSERWRLLFRSPNFIKNHLNHAISVNKFNFLGTGSNTASNGFHRDYYIYSRTFDDVLSSSTPSQPFLDLDYHFMSPIDLGWIRIEGSCRGLVCVELYLRNSCIDRDRLICILNPATREYKPVPTPLANSNEYFLAHGFGYDYKNDDYKVLRILGFREEDLQGREYNCEVRLYSLTQNSWKSLRPIPYDFFSGYMDDELHHNGVLYWRCSCHVVCFDISNETFRRVLLPNNISHEVWHLSSYLGIWEDKLCILRNRHMENPDFCEHENDHIDVWTMTDYKWSHVFKITADMRDMYGASPIQTLQNGEILFRGREGGPTGLLSYDPNPGIVRARHNCYPDTTYIETLVPLNSGTYVVPMPEKVTKKHNKKRKRRNGY